jgi:hypothetical protein
MNRIKNIFSVFAFSAALLALPVIASAQWNGGGYPNGGYPNGNYPNGNYPNNGGYGNYGRDIRGTVDNLYNQAKDFERTADRGYSRVNDQNFRRLVDQFVDATKDLKNQYGRGRDLNNSADEAQRVLGIASEIDNQIGYNGGYGNGGYGNGGYGNGGYGNGGYGDRGGYRNNRGGYGNNYGLDGQWNQMRGNLQVIADTYGSYNGGYRNNRNRNNGGQWRNRVPFPLPF